MLFRSAALALVFAGAELRFLWLTLATAVLIAAVTVCRRSLSRERARQDQDVDG